MNTLIPVSTCQRTLFLSFDSAKVQSDYPIDKNKKIRLESDEPNLRKPQKIQGKEKTKKIRLSFRKNSIGWFQSDTIGKTYELT